ncbi:fibronectin type III domain-containing protein 7-like [Erpetoichthys calabaricus]|uniref:fibronectin type III domain-containing protein 7-like n=1 Tax=Erpetoichthys calabaricus TaxID=27687 RepID=UPI002234C570|nr:fibronectin type III domain-containing protein 7-like [Erpetoichthys calabaricus]
MQSFFSWNASLYAAYYSAIAVASNGTVVECRTVDTSCFFTNFTCGMGYVLTVSAYNNYCNSNRSASIRVQTAPCEPHNVKIRADCQMDMLVAEWDYAAGALSYTIEATSSNGQQYNCSSFMNSCVIPEVNCGESLNAWIIASDDECNNSKALSEVVETVPCTPSVIKADAGCTADSVAVFWADTNGAVTYISTAEGSDGEQSFCTSSQNNCHLTDLPCGQSYSIYVIASDSKCNSSRSNTVLAYTAPCQPTYPNVFVDCITNQVLVMWEQSQGSSSYKAILQGSNGQNLTCNATLDNCQIQNLPCGQKYNVSVMGQDGICTSPPSDSVLISSVPCGPAHIEADIDCLTGIVTVLWDASEGAQMYSAIAESVNGTQNICNSTDTNCIMAGLECGQPYMISVRSSSGNCQSMPSKEVLIQQVPCIPQKVKSQPTCPESSLKLSWASSVGASSYTAEAWEEDHLVICSSTEPSCEFQDLKCGWTYHINVTASGGNCTSAPSLVHSIQTAPCPPKKVTSQIDYTTNIVTLEWEPGRHANTYTATAIGNYGHVTSCQSTNSSCQFKDLRCGEKYNFSMTATDGNCDSIQVMVPEQETAPCIPQNMVIILDCDTNIALATWDRSKGALGYTAVVQDVNGKMYAWNTTDTSCSMAHLQCGLQHSITVKALSAKSNSANSNVTIFQTVPCVPLNVPGNLECSTNVWNVLWAQSAGAIFYSLRLSGPNNDTRTFSSENTSFSIGDLLCAEDYSVTVSAIGRKCNSSDSYPTFIKTVPCTPLNIETHLDCSTNIASVTWDHSKGAMSYRAIAESSTGHTASCNTSDNNCDISFLQCGQKYNISVVAEDNKCSGFRSSFTEIETAPCPPENVAAVMDCNNKTATVSWSASGRAVSYNVSAEENGEQISSCSTQDTSCNLSDLQCGRNYDVTVTPIARGCTGFKSSAFKLFTGPCPPMNVEAKFDCLTKYGLVSWDLEPGAQVYEATATEDDGHTHTCTTNSTECAFMDLHCGSIYTVTVVAINGKCSSANSLGSQIKTAPCTPEIKDVQLYCEGNLISVLWDQTKGARSYVLSVDSPDGKTASLVTNDTSQDVTHLQCGTIYMFWLTAQGEMCNTSMMHLEKRETAPCPPRNVQAEMDCGLNTGNVTWEKSNGAQSYIAFAEGQHGHLTSCNSIGTSCDMKLDCGQLYHITVLAANNNCNSSNEAFIYIASAPCLPQNVQAELDCSSNNLSIQWQQSAGAESYTAMAIGSNGVTATCNTTDTACNISSLECGGDIQHCG